MPTTVGSRRVPTTSPSTLNTTAMVVEEGSTRVEVSKEARERGASLPAAAAAAAAAAARRDSRREAGGGLGVEEKDGMFKALRVDSVDAAAEAEFPPQFTSLSVV